MSKVITIVQKFSNFAPKKHSVRADADASDKSPILGSAYLMKEAMVKAGVKSPDSIKEVKITVEVTQ